MKTKPFFRILSGSLFAFAFWAALSVPGIPVSVKATVKSIDNQLPIVTTSHTNTPTSARSNNIWFVEQVVAPAFE